jgi:sigma-B regulation protein RsbU (phosphoserine phosphatase)
MLGRMGQPWKPLEARQAPGAANLPLGVLSGVHYTQEELRIEPGDRLFLYTDGVAECPGTGDAIYGDEEMLAVLNRTSGKPLAEIRDTLRGDLARYAGGSLDHDDVTYLLVEVLQPPPFWKRRIFAGKARATGAK